MSTGTSTPPLVPDSPGRMSPSKLAKSPQNFRGWMARAKVTEDPDAPAAVKAHFDNLYRIEEVPSALVKGPLPTPVFNNDNSEADFQRVVHKWASNLPQAEGDEYGILGVLNVLALAWSRIRKTSNNRATEHTQRRGVDDIIEIAFNEGTGRRCGFSTEERYRLVQMDDNPDALSDILVTISSTELTRELRAKASTNGAMDDFSIIAFPGEFKKDDSVYNKNQLIMVLTTAQSQRRALGLEDTIVMGATGCRGRVAIYSSYWLANSEGDFVLYIYAHKQEFYLGNPVDVIRLYVFCSKLEKYLQDNFASELRKWKFPGEEIISRFDWRSRRAPSNNKRRRPTADASTPSGDGGRGDDGGLVDAAGFDYDQLMEVMKWRREVIEDGKEAKTISAEDDILSAALLQIGGRDVASVL
ncbi:hypothetical protein D9615_002100 [Tricholomella constricta]|uniref:Uncharacterized protein n=1 Tax=Tricholomella constricta TaxID=117010 RepID=A0A8H5HP99_9AGAR|nr:hypothetical protein D9615_002100 [Tricholomella constricta]